MLARSRARLLPVLLAALSARAGSAHGEAPTPGYQLAPIPDWVEEAAIPPPPAAGQGSPESDALLEDHQVRLGTDGGQSAYWRRVRRVNTPAGVAAAGELAVSFDPSWQQLVLHQLRIVRAGTALPAFDPAQVQIVQAEAERDQRLYSGQLTAVFFPRGMQPGDILDLSYTLEGANPILRGRHADVLDLGLGEPVERIRHRLLRPAGRPPLRTRAHNTEIRPAVLRGEAGEEWVWEARGAAPYAHDEDHPGWYDPVPSVELAEFADWAEVAAWAEELFADRAGTGPLFEALLARIQGEGGGPEAQALRALRWVQDEIRYLGIELGRSSHEPHPPEQVLDSRYGDCKDKSLLLSLLLRRLGHEAWPALVNTSLRRALDQRLPSPFAFDHVIVKAIVAGRTVWVDPTLTGQGGDLRTGSTPLDERALPVRRGTTALEAIPLREEDAPMTRLEEEWELGEEATRLTVAATYRSRDADEFRRDLAARSAGEVASDYLNHYARYDPSLRVIEPLRIRDDRAGNTISTRERYELPAFGGGRGRRLRAWLFDADTKRPRTVLRAMPLLVEHPLWLEQVLRLPAGLVTSGDDGGEPVLGPAFRFERRTRREGGMLTAEFRYRSLRDAVQPADMAEHLRALDAMDSRLELDLRPGGGRLSGLAARPLPLWSAALAALLAGLLGGLLSRRRAPRR